MQENGDHDVIIKADYDYLDARIVVEYPRSGVTSLEFQWNDFDSAIEFIYDCLEHPK